MEKTAKKKPWRGEEGKIGSGPDPNHHGASGYVYGCRCDICREAHSERHRRYRDAKRAEVERLKETIAKMRAEKA